MGDSKDFQQWIEFAETDWRSAFILLNTDPRNAVWLFQQSIEKYLKAMLLKNNQKPPKTHDIDQLFALNGSLDVNSSESKAIEFISFILPKTRYPDDFTEINHEKADEVRKAAKILRDFARSHLELKEGNDE